MIDRDSHASVAAEKPAFAWSIIGTAVLLALFGIHQNRFFVHDDAFITFRYATHLAHGLGVRWNQVGNPVEGFSSPLHLILVAAAIKIGFAPLLAARCIGFTSHALLAGLVFKYLSRRSSLSIAAMACALVIGSWPLLVWDLGGLEVSLFSLLLCAGIIASCVCLETYSQRWALLSGAAFGAALLTRSEALSVLVTASLIVLFWKRGTLAKRVMSCICILVSAILIYVPWEVFRWSYYHEYLPNTYWAKVGGVPLQWMLASGTLYLRLFLTLPPFLLVLALVAALASLGRRRFLKEIALLWASITAYATSVVFVGGDHMTAFRFLAPIIPLLALSVGLSLETIQHAKRPLSLFAWSGLFLITTAMQAGVWHLNPRWREVTCAGGEVVGKRIREVWPADSSVALNVAGALPYYADGFVYTDMLGLNDRTIAKRQHIPQEILGSGLVGHLKGDGNYILSIRPDYIIFETAFGTNLRPNQTGVSLTPFELARTPQFFSDYEQCTLELTVPEAIQRESVLPKKGVLVYYQNRALGHACAK